MARAWAAPRWGTRPAGLHAAFESSGPRRPTVTERCSVTEDTITLMRLAANLTRTCILILAVVAVLGATVAGAATSVQKVSERSAVTTLNDGSAAEQAFIFSGLAKGRDLTRWQTGKALRKTLEAATGPGGHALKVSLARPPSPQRGIAGVIYIGMSTHKQLDLATYTSSHHELQIIVTHTPVLS